MQKTIEGYQVVCWPTEPRRVDGKIIDPPAMICGWLGTYRQTPAFSLSLARSVIAREEGEFPGSYCQLKPIRAFYTRDK